MRNAPELDLGEVPLLEPSRPVRRRVPRRFLALVAVAVAVVAVVLSTGGDRGDNGSDEAPDRTGDALVQARARVEVFQHRGLDDVLLIGAPFGVGQRGELVTIDLAAGTVVTRVQDGSLSPPGFDQPTALPEHPDAESAARSPDGQHIAVFTRPVVGGQTGISIFTEGSLARRFFRLTSVETVVGGRMVWSADSEAVYFLASSVGGAADRIIGVPADGSPQTVVRIDELGYTAIAVG
jgi:hypothetical protein